jgi:hypothetical protein
VTLDGSDKCCFTRPGRARESKGASSERDPVFNGIFSYGKNGHFCEPVLLTLRLGYDDRVSEKTRKRLGSYVPPCVMREGAHELLVG